MYLMHYGTKNMKWGVRKYQNEDGSLTAAGKERYRNMIPSSARDGQKAATNAKNAYMKDRYAAQIPTSAVREKLIADKNKKKYDPSRISTPDDFEKAMYDISGSGISVNTSTDAGRKLALNGLAAEAQIKFSDDIKDMDYHTASNLMDVKFENDKKDYGYTIAKALRQSRHDALKAQNERNYRLKNVANNMGKGSMPTSAISAKAKAENEAKVKANIPASAWNQRINSIHTSNSTNKKSPAKGEYGAIQKKNDAMKTSAQYRKETEMHKAMADLYGRNANKKANQASHPTFDAYDRQHGWKTKK